MLRKIPNPTLLALAVLAAGTLASAHLAHTKSAAKQPGMTARLHYQIDDSPVIATPSTKLSFHELKPGDHKITVVLAGNDHRPLGPQDTLTVKVP